jgi:hypothetical protein
VPAWNDRNPDRAAHDLRVRGTAPADVTAEEFERKLWEATERSLRADPSRWVFASALGLGFATASRAGDPRESGLRGYVTDERALRAAQATRYRDNARRPDRRDAALEARRERERRRREVRERDAALSEQARRGWETRRRAHAQPRSPVQPS